MHPYLSTDDQDRIIATIRDFVGSNGGDARRRVGDVSRDRRRPLAGDAAARDEVAGWRSRRRRLVALAVAQRRAVERARCMPPAARSTASPAAVSHSIVRPKRG